MKLHFGPGGNPPSFYQQGHKSSLEIPGWLRQMGLDAYEYEAVRGVRISQETAQSLGDLARRNGISLSIHAPYFINLASDKPEGLEKSRGHIIKSLRAAKWMGAVAVVLHACTSSVSDRKAAMNQVTRQLELVLAEAEGEGLEGTLLRPETLGKVSQLGFLDEILEICRRLSGVMPAIDFAHMHAVTMGGLRQRDDFRRILEQIAGVLGPDALKAMHIHFSPVEYTRAGEKRHRTTLDEGFGPDFHLLAQTLWEYEAEGTIICESYDRQAEDAAIYREIYHLTGEGGK